MTDERMTALERLALTVAGLVIAAAITGIFTVGLSIQKNLGKIQADVAVVSTQMQSLQNQIERNRQHIQKNASRIGR